jgi:hypothetical protein
MCGATAAYLLPKEKVAGSSPVTSLFFYACFSNKAGVLGE